MIYLASPYTHTDKAVMVDRFSKAMQAAKMLAVSGRVVYSPIVHWHPIAVLHDLPRDIEFWRRQNFGMLRLATEIVVLQIDGTAESKGVKEELELARQLGIPDRPLFL